MKRYVDVSGKQFSVSLEPEAKTDQNGQQNRSREGAPMWTTQIYVLDESGGEIIKVTTAGEKPKCSVGQHVTPVQLEMIPWSTNGRSGVAYRAIEIKVASGK